ncbi:hypothetical protein LAZ67_7001492 [Cordylochernes scorpioides]|uniref:Peptidase A2 domain-containing protein n=1 Tax=Cordylochernes scorpioides TaxID=51811 RepID=A0ABY6KSD7_9ARAC|nr:hypothetical protein LAZ67_7001492 [Cordylochernes scorpioides]
MGDDIVFWDYQGITLIDYLKWNTITGKYYATLLDRLKEEVRSKRSRIARKMSLFTMMMFRSIGRMDSSHFAQYCTVHGFSPTSEQWDNPSGCLRAAFLRQLHLSSILGLASNLLDLHLQEDPRNQEQDLRRNLMPLRRGMWRLPGSGGGRGHVKRYCRERRQCTQRPEGHEPSNKEPQMGNHQAISQISHRQSPYQNRGRSPRLQSISPTSHTSQSPLNIPTSNEGEAASVKSPPSSTAAKLQQNYVVIIIDDIAFSALVDSGASFSVISD